VVLDDILGCHRSLVSANACCTLKQFACIVVFGDGVGIGKESSDGKTASVAAVGSRSIH